MSHLSNADKLFTNEMYSGESIDELKKIHEIYTKYLLEYRTFGEPYPSVIETLEVTNKEIDNCISAHKHPKKQG